MMIRCIFLVVALAQVSFAEEVKFRNRINVPINVKIFSVGNPTPVSEFTLGSENVVAFNFTGNAFDIQILPTDDPASGFRHANVPLAQFNGQEIPLGGEHEQVVRCYSYRRFFRCQTCCSIENGRRTATTLFGILPNGQMFFSRAPMQTY